MNSPNVLHPAAGDPSIAEFDTRSHLTLAARQAEERRYHEFMIVDVDCHHYETDSFAEVMQYVEDPVLKHTTTFQQGANLSAFGSVGRFQEMNGRITRYAGRRREKTPSTPHRDITLTRRWMDALGVDVGCIFPTPMLGLALHPQVEVEVGMARAYNRWLVERILSQDQRLKSMLYLPFNDPVACLKMVEEFGDKPGVIGFMVTAGRYRGVHDNLYAKTYAALEERDLALSFHASFNWSDQMLSLTNRFISAHALGFSFFNVVHMTNWIINGLPERFPKLKTVWIESGLAWIPFVMQRLDNEYMMRSSEAPLLKKLPSDYMRDMYYTSQPMEQVKNARALEVTFEMINAETQLLYSSDYPHWDMDLPSTIYDLPFLTEKAKRNILGENARRLFKLDHYLSDAKRAKLEGRAPA